VKLILLGFVIAACASVVRADGDLGFPACYSPRLGEIDKRIRQIDGEMRTLPVMSDIDARGTHGFHSNFSHQSEEHWFEIRWDKPQLIDGIGMVPTRITTQSGLRSNYGLPARMRIEATRAGETKRFVLTEIADTRLDLRRGEPIFLNVNAAGITSLRFIPIDLPTLPGKAVRFFSLAEVMVYQGLRNIAREGKTVASYSIDGEVGWNIHYLTDEQSPLGPPELPQPGNSLGWHGDLARGPAKPTWAVIDLGEPREFDSIRLVAARGDAPLKGPGFGFPVRFRFEVANEAADGEWNEIWTTGETDMTNPGYNPRTFRFTPARGRFVRVSIDELHAPDAFTMPRILLSEMEVLHGLDNLALNRPVSTPDGYDSIPHDATRVWSRAGLTDGYSSTGHLIPEREWAGSLSRRFDLICETTRLGAERAKLVEYWHRLFLTVTFTLLSAAVIGLLAWQMRIRMQNRRTMLSLRGRISSDLHDEVGSNLATIALLSELGPDPGNLDDINRLSRETSLALREIVDITLAPERARKPLLDRLRDIATLMLRDHQWSFEGGDAPVFDLEQRRNLVFYFKESLHNIIRHAGAKSVRIVFENAPPDFRLIIEDDGKGIQTSSPDVMGNLNTLRQRAESLRGKFEVDSKPGEGTRLTLAIPIHHRK
jgi:signal transduction histidine kinase